MVALPYDRSRAIALAGLDYAHFLPNSSDTARLSSFFAAWWGRFILEHDKLSTACINLAGRNAFREEKHAHFLNR